MKSSKSDLRHCSQQSLLEKLRSKFHESKPFLSLISPEVAHLFFFAALRFVASRLCRIPVLVAGSFYPSYFATESALYRQSDACLIRKTGIWNKQLFFMLLYSRNHCRCFPAEIWSCGKLKSTDCCLHVF